MPQPSKEHSAVYQQSFTFGEVKTVLANIPTSLSGVALFFCR